MDVFRFADYGGRVPGVVEGAHTSLRVHGLHLFELLLAHQAVVIRFDDHHLAGPGHQAFGGEKVVVLGMVGEMMRYSFSRARMRRKAASPRRSPPGCSWK
jgi:hypothetical protein